MKRFISLLLTLVLAIAPVIIPGVVMAGEDNAFAPYSVTYYPGAAATTGSVPVDANEYGIGDEVTVLGPGTLARPGYTFAGWEAEYNPPTMSGQVWPVVTGAPEDVIAAGLEEEFMLDYGTWVELYKINEGVGLELIQKVQVTPGATAEGVEFYGGTDSIGTFTLYRPEPGTYFMQIFRPGYIMRYCLVTVDENTTVIEVPLAATEGPGSWYEGISDSRPQLKTIEEQGVFVLFAGEIVRKGYVDNRDLSTLQSLHIYNKGSWLDNRHEFGNGVDFNTASFAGCDLDGDGILDFTNEANEMNEYILTKSNVARETYNYAGSYEVMLNLFTQNIPGISSYFASGFTGYYFDNYYLLNFGIFPGTIIPEEITNFKDFYNPGDTFDIPGNVTLTAIWIRNTDPPEIITDPPPATTTTEPTTTTEEATTTGETTTTEEATTTTEETITTEEEEITTTEEIRTTAEEPAAATTSEPVTEAPTEPAIDEPTEAYIDDEEYEEETISNRVPLDNGWFAEYDEEEDVWYIYDENGTPLGTINLPEGESIENYDVESNIIPFAEIESTPDDATDNPKTGDSLYIALGLMTLAGAGMAAFRKRLAHK